MGILMPALARVRQLAFRMTCGTNLSGIGKAMMIYANDYEDELPRSGGRNTEWGQTRDWMGASRFQAFGLGNDGSGGSASISSCFYLLVKYAEVTPKSFVCKGDAGTNEFSLSDLSVTVPTTFELIDAWDFGPPVDAYKHCSYSYHIPFNLYALTTSSEPGFAVAADRNPWIISPAAQPNVWGDFIPDLSGFSGGSNESARVGNAIAHQSDGQQVLFLDIHVEFAKRAYCSIEDDNIYTLSGDPMAGATVGTMPQPSPGLEPSSRKDSLLVHDPDQLGGGTAAPPARR
jgi:hypothetical protein